MNKPFTKNHEYSLVSALSRLRQPWPAKVYYALASKVRFTAIETVMLQQFREAIYVLMFKRPHDDPFYANLWHSPGSISRESDCEGRNIQGVEDALTRICDEIEIKRVDLKIVRFVDFVFLQTPRGPETSLIFCCTLTDGANHSPNVGWYDSDKLPYDTVQHHKDTVIPIAAKFFKENYMH